MAQPEGLVVTASSLDAAEANITWPVNDLQVTLKAITQEDGVVLDIRAFLREILDWSDELVAEGAGIPKALEVHLDGDEVLTPRYALRSPDHEGVFVLLVGVHAWTVDLDRASDDRRWTATPHQKFERLLRDSGVHVGLLSNGKVFRLVYAPKGRAPGSSTSTCRRCSASTGASFSGRCTCS